MAALTPKQRIVNALDSMCYRQVRTNKWAKPVGSSLFLFDLDCMHWTNWFLGANKAILVWERKEFSDDSDPLLWIKEREAYTRIDLAVTGDSHFELATSLDIWDL